MKLVRPFRFVAALAAALLLVPAASAAPVDADGAKLLVQGYRAYMDGEVLGGRLPAGDVPDPVPLTADIDGAEATVAWVFEFPGGGWMVVSADDTMDPVPAFSHDGEVGDAFTNEASPARFFLLTKLVAQYRAANGLAVPMAAPNAEAIAAAAGEGPLDEATAEAVLAVDAENAYAFAQEVQPAQADRWARFRAAADPNRIEAPTALASLADIRVPTLMETRWSQSGSGENYYTPGRVVCGCTQTAMGQAIFYHKWPQSAPGQYENVSGTIYNYANGQRGSSTGVYSSSPSYYNGTTTISSGTNWITRGGNGSGGAYQWDKMYVNSTKTPYGKYDQAALGALLVDIGIVNGASYKSGGTGANNYPAALMKVFKFDNIRSTRIASTHATTFSGTGASQLTNAVMCNLDAKIPCPIAGWVVSGSSGHATVMDGYGFQDGQAYFHVNFGWGGSSDGYYTWDNWGGYSTSFVYYNMFPQGTGEIVSGRTLTPDGRPIPNLAVTCTLADGTKKTVTSDSRGIWAVTRIPSETTVSFTAAATSDYTFGTKTATVGKSSQTGCQPYTQDCGNVWGVELRGIPRGAMVWGSVKNPEGQPIPGVRVVTGDGRYSATTDSLGVYSLNVAVGWSGVVKLADGQGQLGCDPASYNVSALSAGTALERNFRTALVLFVDCDATDGANDGTSWADAFTDLQSALARRKAGAEIWVAEGVYKPGAKRTDYFQMVTNVAVYGGFSGVETARAQRNWIAHRTVLSGDIGVAGTKTDNCAILVGGAPGAALDGFTVTDAYYASYDSTISSALNKVGTGTISSRTGTQDTDFNFLVEHCLVTGNTFNSGVAYGYGNFRSCVFADNSCGSSSGNLCYGGQYVNCTFANNAAYQFSNAGSWSTGSYPLARFQNCYFKQALSNTSTSGYGQYYYASSWSTDPSTLYADHNLHRTADTLSITNSTMVNGAALQRADETLAGPPAAPYMPPSSSKAKDKGVSQGWAANATDYLGNPRVNGTIDIGAYEITTFAAPFVALGVGDVSYHTASATLSVISLGGTATSGSAVLKYGTSANLSGAESVSASVGIGEKTFSLSGLLAGTTYYVQVTVTGSGTTSTEILSFTTKPMTAPDVAIGTVGEPTGSTVSVDWSLASIGKGVTKATVYVDYSTSPTFATYESKTVKENATGAASGTANLTGLSAGVTYYLRVRGVNDAPLTGYSATKTVTTVDAAAPDFSFTVAPSETVTRGVVTLSVTKFGTGASSGTATIEYATKADFSDAKTATAAVTRTGDTEVTLTRLSAGTTYYVRVTLVNNNQKSLARAAQTFETGDPGFVAPGLKQVRYSCSGSSYPDFDVTVANASTYSTYAVERAPGPFMADITGSSCSAQNPYTGTTWAWANNTTYYYEGEMFFKGGVTYNFFHYVDDGVAIELDGEWFTRQSAGNVSGYNAGATVASKTYASDGWHAIRIWVYDWSGGKGYCTRNYNPGKGIGWNTNGCTTANAANNANWSLLRDPGDASLLRVRSSDSMPSFVELNDDLMIAGTTLTGSIHTDGVEDGCTITLYAGHVNAGSNAVDWAQSKVIGTVPSESYDLSFQWDEFCSAGDLTGWFVIARMTNASGTYEGWSVVREPTAGNVFYVAIQEGETGLTTIAARPRVAGFGDGAASASVCLEYSTDANFGTKQSTAAVTTTTTNWLSSVTISGLTPNTVYYVRTKGVKGSQTVYSRTAQLATQDYGTPVASLTVGTTTLSTIPLAWSVTSLGLGNTGAEVWLDYGTSAAYGQSVKLKNITGADSGTYTLSDLPGETTYHFRLRVVASPSGKVGTSAAASGSTKPVGNPTVTATLGAVAQYTATFSYNLSALGEGAVSAALYYDVATSSDFSGAKSTSIASGITSVPKVGTATATGLSAETTYYLRVRAVNHAGKVGTSATMTFTTTAVGDPEVAVDMTDVLQRAATATISIATLGEAAKSATVTLEYGTSTSYGKTATVSGTPAAGAVLTALLEGLEPETTYYVRVTVKNDANKTGVATTSFKTLEPNDPVFTHTVTPSYTAGSFMLDVTKIGNGATSASGYVRWGTSASALTSGPAALSKIVEPGTMSGAATGLSNSTTYYYEIVVTNNLTGQATATGSFTTKSPGNLNWGEGYYQGGLLQGYNKGNGQQWGLDVSKSSAQAARWNSSGYVASFAYGAVASYQTKSTSNWTNPYDGATYPMDSYNRMWAYGGQMWMEKGVKYYFAVNFFYAASISVDGEVVCSEENGGNATPQVGSVTPTTTGWHDIAIAVGSNGNGAGAANNPWNSGSPFTSLRYGTAWNTNGLSSVTSSNASQWKQLLDAGDRHLFRARGKLGEMAFLDQPATWTSSSLTVPVRLDSSMDGLTLKLYASRSPDAWYFEDRWEKTVTVGSVGEGAAVKSGTFSGIQVEAGVDWYVSARLYNAAGTYDQWTDPVKFTPQVVKQPPAGNVTVGTPTFTSNTATVNVTSKGDETGTVAVVLEYATDQAFTTPVTKTGTAVSAPGSQDFTLTGLQPGRTYYVRARLTGSALGLVTVTEAVSFTTPSYTPPVIASVTASSAGANSGTVVVDVSSLGQGSDSATIEVFVSTGAFGATPAATRTITATGTQTFTITGLQAGTAYFVKVVVTGSNGLSATNTDGSFVTGTVEPPSGTLRISNVGRSSATATVSLVSLGDDATSCAVAVEYATDAAFSSKKTVNGSAATAAGSQVLTLTGLAGETKYYARAVFTGSPSGLVGYSETVEFTTPGAQGPAATLEVTSITFDGATATVHVTTLGDDATSVSVKLEIAENAAMTGATTVGTQTTAKAGDVAFLLSELEPGKTYYLKATLTGSPSGLSSTATASFATTAYGAPVIGAVTDTKDFHSATLAVPITDLGAGSDSVALSVCVDVEYGCTGGETKTASLDAPGTATLSWSDLEPGTKYYWYVKATGSNGQFSEARGDFTTPLFPLVIGEASAVAGDNGLSATMRVSLLNLASPPATVKLYLDGELVRTWSDVAEAGDFEHTATTVANKKYQFKFVATAGGQTVEASGSFTTVAAEDWFNVRWGEDGYATGTSWNVAGAVSKSGGSWTRPADDESAFDGARLSLVPPEEGVSVLRFAPTKSVKKGADVTVEGSTVVSVGSAAVEAPSGTRGGLVFLETGPMGWTRDGWISLKGAVPEAGDTVSWKMEVALSGENAPAIRYTIGETVLSDADGREWFSLPASVTTLGGVGFAGGGKLGDFRGFYKAQIVGKFEKPNFGASTPDGDALGFGVNAAGKPTFSVSIDNASADAVYGVYVCATVDGDYVRDRNAVVAGSGEFRTFTVSAENADTQFVVIVAAEEESQLVDHLSQIEGLEN